MQKNQKLIGEYLGRQELVKDNYKIMIDFCVEYEGSNRNFYSN